MTEKINYNRLYSDMVKLFAVKQDGKEDMSLGDYMRSKANVKNAVCAPKATKRESNLPVAVKHSETHAISAFFTYVNDKLTVKRAPVRDKTIRRFPLRTAISSFLCAFVICAVMVCYALIGVRGGNDSNIASENKYEYSENYQTTLGFDETDDLI